MASRVVRTAVSLEHLYSWFWIHWRVAMQKGLVNNHGSAVLWGHDCTRKGTGRVLVPSWSVTLSGCGLAGGLGCPQWWHSVCGPRSSSVAAPTTASAFSLLLQENHLSLTPLGASWGFSRQWPELCLMHPAMPGIGWNLLDRWLDEWVNDI